MSRFFNFFWSLSQNWLKSKKIWKTINKKKGGGGNFVEILTKIRSVGMWMGHFFVSPELSSVRDYVITSGVARAFPGGRVAHPEGQNEEENSRVWR